MPHGTSQSWHMSVKTATCLHDWRILILMVPFCEAQQCQVCTVSQIHCRGRMEKSALCRSYMWWGSSKRDWQFPSTAPRF